VNPQITCRTCTVVMHRYRARDVKKLPVAFAPCLRYPFMKAQTEELQKSWGPVAHHVARHNAAEHHLEFSDNH